MKAGTVKDYADEATTDFDWSAVEREAEEDAARSRQETLVRLLQFLADGQPNAAAVGRRALLLVGVLERQSCSQVGKALGVSRQRASKLLTGLRRKVAQMLDE